MSYNSDLQANNAELQAILNTVNALPDANSGGGYVCRVITVNSGQTVIETGLSSIVRFDLRKNSYAEVGLISASHPMSEIGTDTVLLISCSNYTSFTKTVNVKNMNTSNYFTINGGTITWKGTSEYALSSGKNYTLIVWGIE